MMRKTKGGKQRTSRLHEIQRGNNYDFRCEVPRSFEVSVIEVSSVILER